MFRHREIAYCSRFSKPDSRSWIPRSFKTEEFVPINALALLNWRDKEAPGKVEPNERGRGHSVGMTRRPGMTKFFSPTLRIGREGWGTLVFLGASGTSGSVHAGRTATFGRDDTLSSPHSSRGRLNGAPGRDASVAAATSG
jgi:hypothetical protein